MVMMRNVRNGAPAIWAGVECTVNRVGDVWSDQLERTGHAARPDDIDRLAGLQIRTVRYPVLWERVAPHGLATADWSWSDARLARIRAHGLTPIVGLVHHGSGPAGTDLLDANFPTRLAAYAGAVAERYPWVECFTPINEPLTTARFSALYGHWYPHHRDARSFARAFVHQIIGVRLAMAAIRRVVPAARLIQTEDLGKTYATRVLQYQAEYENERRWLTWDALVGLVDRHHPLWQWMHYVGLDERELAAAFDEPCPPDVIGINHYLTSERFLDHRVDRYPPHTHGSNGRHPYADVEAVRVLADGLAGPRTLLRETWTRYGRPIAITEAHLGCTREDQMRWLAEVWQAACAARVAGEDVRAVTAWSAFGACDWASLLTRVEGRYESGLFDVRASPPRPTALAIMVRAYATRAGYDHPLLDERGWWHDPRRLCYEPVHVARGGQHTIAPSGTALAGDGVARRELLVVGGGRLARGIVECCAARRIRCHLLTRAEMDVTDHRSVADALAALRPWAVINAAGFTRMDDAELPAFQARCWREHLRAAVVLAHACRKANLPLVAFSTDLVFDGAKGTSYTESDAPAPLSVYGASHAAAEMRIRQIHPAALVIRTAACFGAPVNDMLVAMLTDLAASREIRAANDVLISPTYLPHLASATLDLLIDGAANVWHLASAGACTWADLVRAAAGAADLRTDLVDGAEQTTLGLRARRPACSVLASERGTLMPPFDAALADWVGGAYWAWRRSATHMRRTGGRARYGPAAAVCAARRGRTPSGVSGSPASVADCPV